MSVILYRKNDDKTEAIKIEPEHLEGYLSIGWSLEKDAKKTVKSKKLSEKETDADKKD